MSYISTLLYLQKLRGERRQGLDNNRSGREQVRLGEEQHHGQKELHHQCVLHYALAVFLGEFRQSVLFVEAIGGDACEEAHGESENCEECGKVVE